MVALVWMGVGVRFGGMGWGSGMMGVGYSFIYVSLLGIGCGCKSERGGMVGNYKEGRKTPSDRWAATSPAGRGGGEGDGRIGGEGGDGPIGYDGVGLWLLFRLKLWVWLAVF